MNILWVASPLTDTRGGALTVTRNIVQGLKDDSHTYLGSCGYMGEMFEENGGQFVESFAGFEPVTIKNWLLMPVSFVLGLAQVVKHRKLYRKADRVILATCHTEAFFTLPWVLLWFKKPVIVMNHTGRCPQSLYKNPLNFIMKWIYNHSQVVFVSHAHLDMWKQYNFAGTDTKVVHNGVKVNDFAPVDHSDKTDITFGYLGRIEEQKGLETLFTSLESISLNKMIKIRVGGVGADEIKYKTWSSKISSQNPHITFEWLGQVQDTKDFFNSIDCLLFPSKFESFGLVMVEAWERGVPVICSDIPAFRELKLFANELEQGLVFASEKNDSLTTKITYFLDAQSFFQSQSHQKDLHETAQNHFSLDIAVAKIKNIIVG
jgi:glycosyltransferase involved in cell wall biosynthesis